SDALIGRAMAFIRARAVAERPSVGDVARAAGCSRRLLETRFRNRIGSSVKEAITEAVMGRVRDLLERTDTPIGEIASECGFLSDSYLAVVFRRETGKSMTEWRRLHRDAPDE
ncbi:MAG: helix-turn-helix transcriptional regulator, partial [Kiritimatiellae bacterium]|nr:helix-turn-helix transcriptional regulator [Kiritimatiellia bacterium]